MKHNIGDRWIQYIMKQTNIKTSRSFELIWLLLCFGQVVLFVLNVVNGKLNLAPLFLSVLWASVSLLYFERRKFITIIRSQEQDIAGVRQELQTAIATSIDARSNSNVLFVWDEKEKDIITIFRTAFKSEQLDLIEANDIDTAVNIVQREEIHIIIAKRTVKQKDDVFDLIRSIRRNNQKRHIPIIIGFVDVHQNSINDQSIEINGYFGRVFNIEGIVKMTKQLITNPSLISLVDQEGLRKWL